MLKRIASCLCFALMACNQPEAPQADELASVSQKISPAANPTAGGAFAPEPTAQPGESVVLNAPGVGYSNQSFNGDGWQTQCESYVAAVNPNMPDRYIEIYWHGSNGDTGSFPCWLFTWRWVTPPPGNHYSEGFQDEIDSTSCTVNVTSSGRANQPIAGTVSGTINGQPFTSSFSVKFHRGYQCLNIPL